MNLRVKSSLPADALADLASSQLNGLFPDGQPVKASNLAIAVPGALVRLEYCFSHINNKYFFDGCHAVFDHLHGDQYSMWLYFLANELYVNGGSISLCKKLFLLNKVLHGCDIFYEVELPKIFLLVHPLGTVLGRGKYADFFIAYQRVSVGSNHGIYPTLGSHLTLHPGSSVLGNSNVGDHCVVAAESFLLDRELQSNSLYIGNPRDNMIKPISSPLNSIWRK